MDMGIRRKTVILILTVMTLWIFWGNTALEVNTYAITSDRIPKEFEGFSIAQISDFHNAEFGEGNRNFLERMFQVAPDIVVITGDLIDSRRTDVGIALDLVRELVKLAPVYYVTGNHESRVPEYDTLKEGLLNAGATVLEDRIVTITRGGEDILLAGIDDPAFRWGDDSESTARVLSELLQENERYTILLSHRPELLDSYANAQVDLVFSGHAHGGQFRLPLIGGLVAPNQGFFPEYDAGVFQKENTTMIVSRGVGNSIIPLRFNNRPEIVVVKLDPENE